MARSDALALLLAALAACDSSRAPAPPRPSAVTPARGFATADAIVEIAGDGFDVRPVQRTDGGGSRVEASFRAWLGAAELADVAWIDTRTLRARVPAGLALGTYDLSVEGPYGRGDVAGAYEVIAGDPTSLAVAVAPPVEVALGEELQVTVRASNTGAAVVSGVLPAIALGGAGALAPVAVTVAAQDLAAGATHDFVLRYRAVRTGDVTVQGSVAGTDPRTGGSVSATAAAQVAVTPALNAQVIAADPFSDGTRFAFVAAYGGELYVGPNRTGSGIARMQPDGTFAESLALSLPRDSTGNQSTNTGTAPYRSLGSTGCTTNDGGASGCGPDNEDGRGLLASVTFAGSEWLVAGAARSGGDLDFVYMTRDTGPALSFSYVDLSTALGGNTRGFSAARAAGGRLYLGFPDNGGSRPYGVALLSAPGTPGLDAVLGVTNDVVELNLHDAYDAAYVNGTEGASFAGIAMVDAIAELGGRVYFFSDLGCLVSTSPSPATKDDFVACSPALGPAYAQPDSIEPPRQYDLEPRERAWPATAIWNGRLYAFRNTFTGPQLWACDPAGGADPLVCDRSDWTLVAADGAFRTRFGKPDATAATLLVATPTHLYVGFDDAVSGVHVYRTAVARPAVASDFSGDGGCVAGAAGCDGIGGDGFGQGAALSRIFDATAIASGGRIELAVAAGNGTDAVRIVRVAP